MYVLIRVISFSQIMFYELITLQELVVLFVVCSNTKNQINAGVKSLSKSNTLFFS